LKLPCINYLEIETINSFLPYLTIEKLTASIPLLNMKKLENIWPFLNEKALDKMKQIALNDIVLKKTLESF
jgi:hypothetical protein